MRHRVISWLALGAVAATTLAVAPLAAVANERGCHRGDYQMGAGSRSAHWRYREVRERRHHWRAYEEDYREARGWRAYPGEYRVAGYRSVYEAHHRPWRDRYEALDDYRVAGYRQAYRAPVSYRVATYRQTYLVPVSDQTVVYRSAGYPAPVRSRVAGYRSTYRRSYRRASVHHVRTRSSRHHRSRC